MNISILSDLSTQFISKNLSSILDDTNSNITITDYNYRPVESHFYETVEEREDYIIILESTFTIYKNYLESSIKEKFFEDEFKRIKSYLINLSKKSKILFANFFEINDKLYGNQSVKISSSFIYQIRKLNLIVSEFIQSKENILIFDLSTLINLNGYNTIIDNKLYINYGVLFTIEGSKIISESIGQIIKSNSSKIVKCIILDLDNTIWGGVIGDDGIDKLQIGNVGIGKSFTLFQKWLKLIKESGVLLCVCSKNDEEIAKSPFLKHPEMVLGLDDITIFVANWDNKPTNISEIKKKLNIGFDSIVFLDDNKFERDLVRKSIPEIIVPELPEDPVDYLNFLFNENIFERNISLKNLNTDRTNLYKTEFQRIDFKENFDNENDYLNSLNMVCKLEKINNFNIPRISELSKRTNQFNLTGIRFDESDLEKIIKSEKLDGYSFSLKDSFGSYGVVSFIIFEKEFNDIKIINWGMSCRVFKRTLEQFIINKLVFLLKDYDNIKGELVPTSKNKVLKLFLSELDIIKDNIINININTFNPLKTSVKNG